MKTPEDEAFDELERRQGGFQAKRAMAADKLQEPEGERAWFTISELNAWADKKLTENPHWATPEKEVLAQLAQEPVGMVKELFTQTAWEKLDLRGNTKVYITPPQREPLTDEAVLDIADYCLCDGGKTYGVLDFARAIEAAHGIKENT